jgi:tRNA pseudouridine32 synthase/23S rRNA pseudouridine746 synthase
MNDLKCIFQDQHIYAIHKPPGMPFHTTSDHPQAGGNQPNSNSASHDLEEDASREEGIVMMAKRFLNDEQIFPVHRLDKMTSGLMIFARHAQANRALSMALEAKTIEKYYLALSQSKPKKKQGAVIGDMLKARSGSYKLSRSADHPAVTRFFARPVTLPDLQPFWMFALKPETGKTHQLRVAMKSLGSPVLGDLRYGGSPASRGYLHAYKMRFELFGTRYSLSDPDFHGLEFSLDAISKHDTPQQELLTLLSPEALPWPKSAFKLA